MKVVVAPDSFGGTLTARQAAAAIADGWRATRPGDEVVVLPLSDGGEGLLDAVAGPADRRVVTEVAGPLGHPVEASFLQLADGSAVVETAAACGLHLLATEQRDPMRTTTYGVGQLLRAARDAGARRIRLGLGGSATVDGGAGAVTALGFRLTVADGSGLKIGGGDLARVAGAAPGWADDWSDTEVVLLADVPHVLAEAAEVFGPQKGATREQVPRLGDALSAWADVAERELAGRSRRDEPGAGAAGGLGFGVRCALPRTRMVVGSDEVARLVGLDDALEQADLVLTGEGRLDATSATTKVVGAVGRRARTLGVRCMAVVGQSARDVVPSDLGVAAVEPASPGGPGPDPAADVAVAAGRLAERL